MLDSRGEGAELEDCVEIWMRGGDGLWGVGDGRLGGGILGL